jgi:hypothetical protein
MKGGCASNSHAWEVAIRHHCGWSAGGPGSAQARPPNSIPHATLMPNRSLPSTGAGHSGAGQIGDWRKPCRCPGRRRRSCRSVNTTQQPTACSRAPGPTGTIAPIRWLGPQSAMTRLCRAIVQRARQGALRRECCLERAECTTISQSATLQTLTHTYMHTHAHQSGTPSNSMCLAVAHATNTSFITLVTGAPGKAACRSAVFALAHTGSSTLFPCT